MISSNIEPSSRSGFATQPMVATHNGASVQIPPNALVDANDQPPSGQVSVDFTYMGAK